MSLNLTRNKARLTVFGYGWNDVVVDSGDADTDEGTALEEYVADTDYDFPDMDWDALAEDWGVELDDYGNIADTEYVDEMLADLAEDPEVIYEYMTDRGESTGSPARIVILNPPNVTEYAEGDTIDYTGIIVGAFTSLTTMTPFINSELEGEMNNLVPFADLTFPVETAQSGRTVTRYYVDVGESGMEITGSLKYINFPLKCATYFTKTTENYVIQTVNALGILVSSGGTVSVLVASSDPNGYCQTYQAISDVTNKYGLRGSYTYNGKTVYCYYSYAFTPVHSEHFDWEYEFPRYLFEPVYKKIAWLMVYGNIQAVGVDPATVPIPVQWQTDYQTEPYEDTFDITVT